MAIRKIRSISVNEAAQPCTPQYGFQPDLGGLVDDADIELSPLEDGVVGAQTRGGHHRLRNEINIVTYPVQNDSQPELTNHIPNRLR